MENRPDWAQLARYVSGACSPEERRRVEAWVRADPSREQLIEELRSIWAAAEPERQLTPPVDADWEKVRAQMATGSPEAPNDDRDSDPHSREERRPSRRRTPGRRVGMVVAGLLLLGGLWLAQSVWGPGATSSDATTRTVVTQQGERSRLQLADGSSVMLNVDSKLRLPIAFNRQKRIVHLTGEAYFEVEADPDRPFIVRTENASVEVRGTAFTVRGYPDEPQVEVAVAEGGVSMRPRSGSTEDTSRAVELRPGEVGRMAASDPAVRTVAADINTYLGWTEGRLVFENTPLPEVARRLERWYGLTVRIRDPDLRSLRLTANLKSQSVRNVLDVIAASLGIRYEINRDSVLLRDRERRR